MGRRKLVARIERLKKAAEAAAEAAAKDKTKKETK